MYKMGKDIVFDHFWAPCTCIPLYLVDSLSFFLFFFSLSLSFLYIITLYVIILSNIIYIRIFCTIIF